MTDQETVDGLVLLAVDALVSVRNAQARFADTALFGGPAGFDEAVTETIALLSALQAAQRSFHA